MPAVDSRWTAAILNPKDPRVSDARLDRGGTLALCQRYNIPVFFDMNE